jgi:hypothetical protein
MPVAADIAWVGLVLASALMVVSGVLKLRHPESVIPLLTVIRVPAAMQRGRAVGLLEVALGSAAVVTGAIPIIAAEAVCFASFALAISYVLAARIPLSSCGCAGARQTPPSVVHVLVDIAATLGTAMAAVVHPTPIGEMWPRLELLGIPTIVGIVTAVSLLMAAMGSLTELMQACTRIRAAGLVYQHPQEKEVIR